MSNQANLKNQTELAGKLTRLSFLVLEDLTEMMLKLPSGSNMRINKSSIIDRAKKTFKYTPQEFASVLTHVFELHKQNLQLESTENTEICIYSEKDDVKRFSIHYLEDKEEIIIYNLGESSYDDLMELMLEIDKEDMNLLFFEQLLTNLEAEYILLKNSLAFSKD